MTSRPSTGTVYLVGAGPGDPELITLRGADLLRRAGVVLHDALVDRRLLELAHPDAHIVDVGIRAGSKGYRKQSREERRARIYALLIEGAFRHDVVVRLKGGDPFVFARGGEEMLALKRAGVPCEVVPGVTAGTGALATAGIPLTHRGVASSAVFVTARTGSKGRSVGVPWPEIARAGGTVVVFMGGKRVADVARELIRHGRDPGTPAALVESGTLPGQRVVTARLDGLAERVGQLDGPREGAGPVRGPAIIVVGEVVALATTEPCPGVAAKTAG